MCAYLIYEKDTGGFLLQKHKLSDLFIKTFNQYKLNRGDFIILVNRAITGAKVNSKEFVVQRSERLMCQK